MSFLALLLSTHPGRASKVKKWLWSPQLLVGDKQPQPPSVQSSRRVADSPGYVLLVENSSNWPTQAYCLGQSFHYLRFNLYFMKFILVNLNPGLSSESEYMQKNREHQKNISYMFKSIFVGKMD